jgi:hypothetical protein
MQYAIALARNHPDDDHPDDGAYFTSFRAVKKQLLTFPEFHAFALYSQAVMLCLGPCHRHEICKLLPANCFWLKEQCMKTKAFPAF